MRRLFELLVNNVREHGDSPRRGCCWRLSILSGYGFSLTAQDRRSPAYIQTTAIYYKDLIAIFRPARSFLLPLPAAYVLPSRLLLQQPANFLRAGRTLMSADGNHHSGNWCALIASSAAPMAMGDNVI